MRAAHFHPIVALITAVSFAACSAPGGMSASPSASVPNQHRHAKGSLVLRIRVPKKHRHHRGARYISPATQSMTLAISGPTPVNQTANLTPTSTGCSSSLTGTFCTLTIPGLLPGNYTANVTTYDGTGGTGTELSAAQAIGFTIVSGVNNFIGITLSGIPVATVVSPADGQSAGTGYNQFSLQGQGAHKFLAQSLDADGNIIAGAGAPTFTIGTPSGSLAGVSTSPSTTTLTAPNKFTVTPPVAFAAGSAQFTVTPTFTGQDTDGCAQTGANCTGAAVFVTMAPLFSWTQLSPATSPPTLFSAFMAFDAATNQLLLFGGDDNGSVSSATWIWNGTNWTQLSPATHPSARESVAGTFDAATNQLVIFGGDNGVGFLSDTWNWDGTNWTQLNPAHSPSARLGASMAYDAVSGQAILFGGFTVGTNLNDTWEWNGSDWTQLFPANSPPARQSAAMAFDAVSGDLVLFGGGNSGGALADTWTWNGTNWTQQSPITSPSARFTSSVAYDAATSRIVLFGGDGNGSLLSDTWTWNQTTWTLLFPATSPSGREGAAMGYDPQSSQLVLFGGFNSGAGYLNDTWSSP